MTIEWDDLRVFQTAVRAGDYSTAARKLGIDRTTVGRRVARLERVTGKTLWEKSAGGYQPTRAGRAILRAAAAMERAMTDLHDELGIAGGVGGSPLRIAGTVGIASYLLPMLAPFAQSHRDISIELVSAKDAVAAVQQRLADIGIAIARMPPAELTGVRIAPFVQARYVRRGADADRRVMWNHAVMLASPQAWARLNAPRDGLTGVEVGSLAAMIDAVRAGMGSAWLWTRAVGDDDELACVEDAPPRAAEASLWLVHRADLSLEPAAQALLATIGKALASDSRAA